MSLFGPPNVEKMKAKRDVKGLIKALGYRRDHRVRFAAADALGEIGTPAVAPLIAALKDSENNVRQAAAGALGQIGDARAVEPLIAALKDGYIDVRQAAAEALGQIVEPLIAALKDSSNSYVRMEAAGMLGQIGDARAVEPLIAALQRKPCHEDSHTIVHRAAAKALGQIGDARAVEPLGAVLSISDARTLGLGCAAARALGQIGKPAIEPLIAALKRKRGKMREEVVAALVQIGWRPGQDESGATYWVVKGEWNKCIEIGAPAVEPLITALENSDSAVREAAAGALIKIGKPAVEPLIAALKHRYSSAVREAARGALGQIGDARPVEPLLAVLGDKEWSARQSAAKSLVILYQSGLLDEARKSLILAQRGNISSHHKDVSSNSDCTHVDTGGIGVEFPV